MSIAFTQDPEAKIHAEGSIRLICAPFRSHEAGLPEWVKNAADAYARINALSESRNIILIFKQKRGNYPASIACLDFVGMTMTDIENKFRIWADPEAAGGDDIEGMQGGHGNGGKCYMTQMFDEYSLLYTVRHGKGNKYGFLGGKTIPGYFPDSQKGRNYDVPSCEAELKKALAELEVKIQDLPKIALDSLAKSQGFTLVKGVGPNGVSDGRVPIRSLVESISNHPQMITTIQICNIFIMVDGKITNQEPLKLEEIEPMPDAKEPRTAEIPEFLTDPITGENVSTVDEHHPLKGELALKTSATSMRWKSKKYRHCIIYRAKNKAIGFKPIFEFTKSYFAERIYGECNLDILAKYTLNERQKLADSPLTRALEEWIGGKIEEYVKEFIKLQQLKISQQQKEELIKVNTILNEWKNQFIKDLGIAGIGGSPGFGGKGTHKGHLPSDPPTELKLTLPYRMAGVDVAFRPRLEFFSKDGTRVRSVPFMWHCSDWNVATVDNELLTITTHAPGETGIWAETLSGKIISNRVSLRVVKIKSIRHEPTHLQLPVGQRRLVKAIATLQNNIEEEGIYLMWQENNPNIANVSAIGMVYAVSEGKTEIAAFDDNCMASMGTIIEVTPSIGKGGGEGTRYPQILLSEIDDDPLNPGEKVAFAPEEGTVCQRVQDVDANIWWINTSTPLARRFGDDSQGYGYKTTEWRVYHLERYIETLIQIKLNHAFVSGEELAYDTIEQTWRQEASAIQLKVVQDLEKFIDEGELPYAESRD